MGRFGLTSAKIRFRSRSFCPKWSSRPFFDREQKGGFVKGRFWRMYPCSGFWLRETQCTLVPVFGTGEHLKVPSFWFWYRETSAKTTLVETTLLRTPEFGGPVHILAVPQALLVCMESCHVSEDYCGCSGPDYYPAL